MWSKKQQNDLETVEYFIPEVLKNIEVTDADRVKFLEYSEKGKHKEEYSSGAFTKNQNGFTALCEGKRWRGIHIHEMYEKGVLDGSMPYVTILEGMPRSVVEFLKKEMFQGADAEAIEKCYMSNRTHTALAQCTHCIMTTNEDPTITFDTKGVCNHCHSFEERNKKRRIDKQELPWIVYEMKKAGRGKKYDCLLGLSGGVDSSMCLHYLIEQGLRPLCFSVDNGWQTPEAQENIMKLVEGLKVPYYRYNLNLEAFRDLQRAFIQSGLKNIEVPTDHVLMAATYEVARQYGIKYIISGGNLATESIMPEHFGYNARDLTHVRGVYKTITGKKLTGVPTISLLQYLWNRFIKKIKIVNLLDYYEYHREEAINLLTEKYGYKPYGEKHSESIFTKWFQDTYLYYFHGLDKRVPHYASLINSGQMKRQEALRLLQSQPKKTWLPFNMPTTVNGQPFQKKQSHIDFPNSEKWWNRFSKIYAKLK